MEYCFWDANECVEGFIKHPNGTKGLRVAWAKWCSRLLTFLTLCCVLLLLNFKWRQTVKNALELTQCSTQNWALIDLSINAPCSVFKCVNYQIKRYLKETTFNETTPLKFSHPKKISHSEILNLNLLIKIGICVSSKTVRRRVYNFVSQSSVEKNSTNFILMLTT